MGMVSLTDVIVLIPIQAKDVATSLDAMVGEDSRQRLELNRSVSVDWIFPVDVQFFSDDLGDTSHGSQVVFEGKSRVQVAAQVRIENFQATKLLTSGLRVN